MPAAVAPQRQRHKTTTELEREQALRRAADRYLRGQMSLEEFEQVEAENSPDLEAAIQAVAQSRSRSRRFLRMFRRKLRLAR